jgi:hypothetical protein
MFRLASGLGFTRFLAHDPYANREAAARLNVELTSIEDVFAHSDFVAVNCLLNEQTRGLIGAEHFRLMKPTAFFINTARGAFVRQADLTQALRERWLLGAGIDVFEKEPVDPAEPLLQLDNVLLAPHALAWDRGALEHALGRARRGARSDAGDRGDDLDVAEGTREERAVVSARPAERERPPQRMQLWMHRREDRDAAQHASPGAAPRRPRARASARSSRGSSA